MGGKQSDRTRALHSGGQGALIGRTVGPPIQRGSTLIMDSAAALADSSLPTYGRAGLQPHQALREALTELEGAADAFLFPSGLGAMTAAILAFVKAGDEVLVADCVYYPTRRFCDQLLSRLGVGVRYFDPALAAADVAAQMGPATRVVVLESPGSLTFEVQDVPALAAAARAAGAVSIIDNTWAAGVLFKPLAHGVDVSVQALTKYVGGHSDGFMGSAAARDASIAGKLEALSLQLGMACGPEDAFLMLRGLRTLPTRMERHGQNALAIGAWLAERPDVAEVICPGLPGSRGHDLWKRNFTGQNGLVSIVLKKASKNSAEAFLDGLSLFGLGFSWGGYESLAIHCDSQLKYRRFPPKLDGAVIRLHVGLEDVDDLKADLEGGFTAMGSSAA